MDGVVEIITGRERRRRWSAEDKLRLVAEMAEPGTRVRAVAARHGVCESLLFAWRRQVRDGLLRAPEMPVFMPVQMHGSDLAVALGHVCVLNRHPAVCAARRCRPSPGSAAARAGA